MPHQKLLLLLILLFSCKEGNKPAKIDEHEIADVKSLQNPRQHDLKDSLQLTHIKGQFYKNKNGFLYQKTIAQQEQNGRLTDIEYFNGMLPQEIDPETFQPIGDSWYAKDSKHIYYQQPTGGGLKIILLKNVHSPTFKVLSGCSNYAADSKHFYYRTEEISNFIPAKTTLVKDKNGKVIQLKMNNYEKTLEE